jgi:2-oxoacid:acceptor oxidoreductase gamma subunit (pyruvate/2-ketoisovalerate family)
VYSPQVSVVLDPTLLETVQVAEGLQEDGILVVNTNENPSKLREQLKLRGRKIWTVPATDIAIKILGRPITNTAMLGAVVRALGKVNLESIEKALKERFSPKIVEKNVEVMRRAYKEAKSE